MASTSRPLREFNPATPTSKSKPPPRPERPSSSVSSLIVNVSEYCPSSEPWSTPSPASMAQQVQSFAEDSLVFEPQEFTGSTSTPPGKPRVQFSMTNEPYSGMLTPQSKGVPRSPETNAVGVKPKEDDRSAQQCRYPVLYKLVCIDNKTHHHERRIDRYSEAPFDGLETAENRQKLSVIDVIDVLRGTFPPGVESRKNQRREDFGTAKLEDSRKPFVVGKDFVYRVHDGSMVRIMSPFVIDFLKEGLKYYPDEIANDELFIKEPYRILAYNYQRFLDAVETTQDNIPGETVSQSHLRAVLDWYQPHYEKEIEAEASLHDNGLATFRKLWLLYKPGTIVYASEHEYSECYMVHSLSHPFGKVGNDMVKQSWEWVLSLWRFDFDAARLVRRSKAKTVQIQSFRGERTVHKLPFVPIRYLDAETKQKLIHRGRRHYQLTREAPVLRHYEGALSGNNALQYSGAVIVDPRRYFERRKRTTMLGTIAHSVDDDDPSSSGEPLDDGGGELYSDFNDLPISEAEPFAVPEMYLLLPGKIRGFALGKKQWAQFDTASFKERRDNTESAFDNLIMNDGDKQLLQALGSSAVTNGTRLRQADFIDGKGLGKVILLHGPPGVGKSFTVECLSQDLERPLLALTVADIGTDQSSIEEKLSGWLDLAQRWNAIVLLDEADTYLERRSNKDLNRNALVTVFLRVLEYFPGMIFLTTNQPGFIDDAFISRLNLCIEYKALTRETRAQVWHKFLSKYLDVQDEDTITTQNAVAEDNDIGRRPLTIRIKGTVQEYVTSNADVVELPLNGRDIRNAMDSAIKLATFRKARANPNRPLLTVEVEIEDFKKALRNKKEFYDYLDSVAGQKEWDRAEGRGARAALL